MVRDTLLECASELLGRAKGKIRNLAVGFFDGRIGDRVEFAVA